MSDFTNFVDNLLGPARQQQQQIKQSAPQPVQQPKKTSSNPVKSILGGIGGFLNKAADFVSPALAPAQRFLEGSKNPLIKATNESAKTFVKETGKTLNTFANRPLNISNLGKSIAGEAINVLNVPTDIASKTVENRLNETGLKNVSVKTPVGKVTVPQLAGFGAGFLIPTGKLGEAGKVANVASEVSLAKSVASGAEKLWNIHLPGKVLKDVPSSEALGWVKNLQKQGTPHMLEEASKGTSKFIRGKGGKFAGSVSSKSEGIISKIGNKVGLQSKPTMDVALAQSAKENPILESISQSLKKSEDRYLNEVGSAIDKLPNINRGNADTALLESIAGNPNKSGFQAMGKGLQTTFQDLVNGRNASSVVKHQVSTQFKDLGKGGLQDVIDFSKGVDKPQFAPARKFFEDSYKYLRANGFELNHKENYLTGLFNESLEQQDKIFKRLSLRPGFTKESFFKDYQQAIDAGLTPKYTKLNDIIGHYAGSVNTAVENKKAWETLTRGGFISPKREAGWTALDQNAFPGHSFRFVNENGQTVTHSGMVYAPDDLAKSLNNYFKQPNSILKSIADFSSIAKNIVLSSGIPGTGINFHGFTTLARSGFSPKAAGYLLRPKSAETFINQNLSKLDYFVRKGLKATTEEHQFGDIFKLTGKSLPKKAGNIFLGLQQHFFEDPLFQKVLPALKLQKAESVFRQLKKSGLADDEAARIAAAQANSFFGGINWEQMGRSTDFQNAMRSVLLAPDLLETQLQLGKGVAKALLDPRNPKGKAYRDFARNFALSYVVINLANKESTGKWAFQNGPGHELEFKVGDTYIRPYASAIDFLRLPLDAARGILQGNLTPTISAIGNRTSGPTQSLIHLVGQTDRFGNPLLKNKFTGEPLSPVQQGSNLVNSILGPLGVPSYVQSAGSVATKQQTPLRGLMQGIELPVRFESKTKTTSTTRRTTKRRYKR